MKPRKYRFNNSTLTIVFGDITQSKSEVLVSSDDTGISMDGGVSRSILMKGGEFIKLDAQKKLPAQLGDVVVSTSGLLTYQKYIFHCLTLSKKLSTSEVDSKDGVSDMQKYILQHSIDKCFKLLHALDINSIAFPCIGAGAAHFPITKVAEIMADTISENLYKTNKQFEIELYLYDQCDVSGEMDYIDIFEHFAIQSALTQQRSVYENKSLFSEEELSCVGDVVLPQEGKNDHQIFISYSRKDKEKVDKILEVLDNNSFGYWIDRNGIYSGENYKEFIVDAIDTSKVVIFVSSVNSNSSINVIRELGYAVKQNKTIIPILLDDAQYAKSIRLDIADIDQIEFDNIATDKSKLITSLKYILRM